MIVLSDNIEIAKSISKYRPNCLVVYPTTDEFQVKCIRFIRGIYAIHVPKILKIDELIKYFYNSFLHTDAISKNEKALVLKIFLQGKEGHKNGYYIHTIV
jgi:pyruvate kinase